jgi:serine/threonine protein kinase
MLPEQALATGVISTLTTQDVITAPGLPLGTHVYMSPEQTRGKEVDARIDLFSFGRTLDEMASGVLPFRGKTIAEIYEGILNRQPTSAVQLRALGGAGNT